jgi:hypothetical protein
MSMSMSKARAFSAPADSAADQDVLDSGPAQRVEVAADVQTVAHRLASANPSASSNIARISASACSGSRPGFWRRRSPAAAAVRMR